MKPERQIQPVTPPHASNLIRFLIVMFGILTVTTFLFHQHLFLHFFLIWNVFLSALPLMFSLIIQLLLQKTAPKWLTAITGLIWLVFYPNAPYMVTDLIHIHRYPWYSSASFSADPSAWFGLVHLVAGIITGCICGTLSLYLLHSSVKKRFGARAGWLFCAAVNCLSGFAIYLGRFLRFNTWDLITRPLQILQSVWLAFNTQTLLLCLIFAVMSMLLYLFFYFCFDRNIPNFRRDLP